MKNFWKKHREIIVYIIVGLLTTAVSYGTRFATLYPFASLLSLDLSSSTDASVSLLRTVAVSLGWAVGVIFAFFANKYWVFRDELRGKSATGKQFGKFVVSRLGTYFVEWGIGVLVPVALIALGYTPFHFVINIDADMIATAISVVVVTVLNYILSKMLVFRKKNEK